MAKVAGAASVIAAIVYWLKFAPIAVVDHVVQRGDIVAEVMGTGTLEARKTATISPKISGRIVEVLVDQGDRVTTGQVLVTLDDRDLQQQVAIADATVTVAHATVDRAIADSARAAAVLEQARRDHARQQGLWQRDIASGTAFDKAVEVLSVAEADVTHAAAAVSEARKQLLAAQKTLDFHRARLDDTVIRAPFDGLIVRRHRDPGDVVAPGGAVLSLIAPQEMWISAWVDETQMAQLEPEQPARVVFRSEPGHDYTGHVARLGRETDRETREFIVDVRVDKLPQNWAVGQRAEVCIQTAHKQQVTVLPAALVIWRDDQPGVFVRAESGAQWRSLRLGLRSRDAIEIVQGLQPGDHVVTPGDGQTRLTPGRALRS